MARVAVRSQLTPEEYLAWERLQTEKHEYHAGDALEPAIGSLRHNWLAGNVQSALKRALDDHCFTFTSDQRIDLDAIDNAFALITQFPLVAAQWRSRRDRRVYVLDLRALRPGLGAETRSSRPRDRAPRPRVDGA